MEKLTLVVDGYIAEITPDDGAFFVEIPRLPGCCTEVDALDEVEAMIRDAKDLWISVARDLGMTILLPCIMEKPIFKLIVAGSRDFCNLAVVREVVDKMLANKLETHRIEIVSGGARGPDTLGRAIAIEHGWRVSVMNADWEKEGKAAGMKRNQRMADYADAALVFWDGNSPGTRNMIQTMIEMRKPIRIAMVDCINQSFVTFASTRELIARG